MTRPISRDPETDLGRRLRAARLAVGVRSGRIAGAAAGLSQGNYWRLEILSRRPAWATVHRLIVGLRLPLEHFFPAELVVEAARRVEAARARRPAQ